MKCPLTQKIDYEDAEGVYWIHENCLKEECAWWHQENTECSILTLGQGMPYIHKVLLEIESKMPPPPAPKR